MAIILCLRASMCRAARPTAGIVAALLGERPFKAMLQTVKKPLARSLQGASFLAPNTSIPHFDLISPQLALENTLKNPNSLSLLGLFWYNTNQLNNEFKGNV